MYRCLLWIPRPWTFSTICQSAMLGSKWPERATGSCFGMRCRCGAGLGDRRDKTAIKLALYMTKLAHVVVLDGTCWDQGGLAYVIDKRPFLCNEKISCIVSIISCVSIMRWWRVPVPTRRAIPSTLAGSIGYYRIWRWEPVKTWIKWSVRESQRLSSHTSAISGPSWRYTRRLGGSFVKWWC